MGTLDGDHTPERREGRPRLTVNDPRVEALLAGITFEGANIGEARSFGNALQREADRWQRRGGFGERGRITKADAARMLALAFRQMASLEQPNSLATYRRDGVR